MRANQLGHGVSQADTRQSKKMKNYFDKIIN